MLSLAAQKAPDLEVWSQLSPYSTGNKEDARQTLSGGPMESLLLHHEVPESEMAQVTLPGTVRGVSKLSEKQPMKQSQVCHTGEEASTRWRRERGAGKSDDRTAAPWPQADCLGLPHPLPSPHAAHTPRSVASPTTQALRTV